MRLTPRLVLSILLLSLNSLADRTTTDILQDANRLLSEGSYNEAARAYGEAIGEDAQVIVADEAELDPYSYVNYYKRATAYLSLGRHSAALDDFDSILRLNPGFLQVRKLRCTELNTGAFPKGEDLGERGGVRQSSSGAEGVWEEQERSGGC